jgi:hypothetical protein
MTIDSAAAQDLTFLTRLRASVAPVCAVAAWLVRNGHTVRIPGLRVRPDASQWRSFADAGDLFVLKDQAPDLRIEVKSTTRHFTNAEDWPFPDMLVCGARHYDDADPKPHRFFIVNPDRTHAAIVRGDQLDSREPRLQGDPALGRSYLAYAVDPGDARFIELG